MDFKTSVVWDKVNKYGIYSILLLAFVLRLVKIWHVFYGPLGELYRDLNVLYDLIHLHHWPAYGPSASLGGFNFGPVYYYLLLPFAYVFHLWPQGLVFASTVFSLFTIYMLYRWLSVYNKTAALIACFVIAVSMIDIQYTGYVSNPNLMPFFIICFLYGLSLLIKDSRRWFVAALTGLCLGVAMQLHATAFVLLPAILVSALAVYRKNISWKIIVSLALGTIIAWLPYLIHEAQGNFSNLRHLLFLGEHNYGLGIRLTSATAIVSFWQSLFVFRNSLFDIVWYSPVACYVAIAGEAVLLCALSILYLRNRKTNPEPSGLPRFDALLLWLWGGWGTVMFLFFQQIIRPFYFLVLWPLPAIVLAFLLAHIFKTNKRAVYIFLAGYVFVQVIQVAYFYRLPSDARFSRSSMVATLSYVKEQAGQKRYKLVNNMGDANMFLFYARMTGIQPSVYQSQADVLYIISDSMDAASWSPATSSPYTLSGIESVNGFLISKYQKK